MAILEKILQTTSGLQTLVLGDNNRCPTPDPEQSFERAANTDPLSLLKRSLEPNEIMSTFGESGEPFSLPFADGRFDLVLCTHLGQEIEIGDESLAEIGRVLRPDGILLIFDSLVPGSRLRGKKARKVRDAGKYINTWNRLRNRRHRNFLSWDTWEDRLRDGKWKIEEAIQREVVADFDSWCACFPVSEENQIRLRAMLIQAPEKVKEFLTPSESGDRIAFRSTEVGILATKASENTV